MGKIKTPIIRPMRQRGGTLYTFSSAIEDIGLNINESRNKVRLSHYVTLDIPNGDEISSNNNLYDSEKDYTINKFNVFTMPGAMWERLGMMDDKDNNDGYSQEYSQLAHQSIAQSFMSYALNMETVIRNSGKYDYTTSLSISERVFWKWLKECGAIRWTPYSVDKKNNYFIEGDSYIKDSLYSNVVKSFGLIDSVSQRSSDYGMYNEIFVNIPASFGYIKPIFFKQVSDENYSFNKAYSTTFTESLENYDSSKQNEMLTPEGLFNVPFFDYETEMNTWDGSIMFTRESYNSDKGKYWFDNNSYSYGQESRGWYYTDKDLNIDNSPEINDVKLTDKEKELYFNDLISVIDNNDYNSFNYQILRSKLDCMSLELSLDNIKDILDDDSIESYDDLSMRIDGLKEKNYEFNTLLLYYSIFDNNDNIIATNLYGVYFLDAPVNTVNGNGSLLSFELPRLSKKQSNGVGFGTSYSFRINVRTSSIYDNTDAIIHDNGSSENSLITDFNNVLYNLSKSVDLLSKHVKLTDKISNDYNDLRDIVIDTRDKLVLADKKISDILHEEITDAKFNNVTTKTLSVDEVIKFSDNIVISGDVNNIIEISEDKININGNINVNDVSLNDLNANNINVSNNVKIGSNFNLLTNDSNDSSGLVDVSILNILHGNDNSITIDISNNILKSNNINYISPTNNVNNLYPITTDDINKILNGIYPVKNGNLVECFVNNYTSIPGIVASNDKNNVSIHIPSIIFALLNEFKNVKDTAGNSISLSSAITNINNMLNTYNNEIQELKNKISELENSNNENTPPENSEQEEVIDISDNN